MRRLQVILWLSLATVGCARPALPSAPSASAPARDGPRWEAAGLHNVQRITDKLWSGSSPEGDEGFQSLRRLGVRTVISVDGARPDVERARQFGLRYVHLPIGYDGVPEAQALRIAKAVRDLPGAVYLHCHHGKHRGPAAAAAAHLCLDPQCRVETALADMRRAGTDPRYTGLYAAPAQLRRPTAAELDRLPAEFPEVAPVTALVQHMVAVEERWGHLQAVRAVGWTVPRDHPDLDPPHEALQLVEHYRESARLAEREKRPEELWRWLGEAGATAATLESVLRRGKETGAVDPSAAETAFRRAGAACNHCHARFRDVPQER